MIDLREVRSVTEFQRNLKGYVGRLRDRKTPMVLTVNGRAELIVQNAGSYQALLDRLERAETVAAIRQGMDEFERGEGMSLKQAERRLRKQHGFSR
ncbi:MAG: type II toxin-antitoxin system Phd/YefM family antitoxin [Terriglobia bacterium]|jgi:PHD/YefM family antitoxin component YafN of YafNO toxin-antitoxin module